MSLAKSPRPEFAASAGVAPSPCGLCRDAEPLDFTFTMAFQPIVDLRLRKAVAYEALVRGTDGSGAYSVLQRVTQDNRYAFDQLCRIKAVELASRLGMEGMLHINFLPNAVYQPETCIRATLMAAERCGFPIERIAFEVAEQENVVDKAHLKNILQSYKRRGFRTAIDDFGAGYAGLSLLADFQPDQIKIDMGLVRGIDADPVRQVIVKAILGVCQSLHIEALAEGVETLAELQWLQAEGVNVFQGYLFARPEIEALPQITWP